MLSLLLSYAVVGRKHATYCTAKGRRGRGVKRCPSRHCKLPILMCPFLLQNIKKNHPLVSRSIRSSRISFLLSLRYKSKNYIEFDRLQKGKYDKIKTRNMRQRSSYREFKFSFRIYNILYFYVI